MAGKVRQAFQPDTYGGYIRLNHSILCLHVRLESLTYQNQTALERNDRAMETEE
jgi:hypothetical protein